MEQYSINLEAQRRVDTLQYLTDWCLYGTLIQEYQFVSICREAKSARVVNDSHRETMHNKLYYKNTM